MKFNLHLEFVLILLYYCYCQTEAQINLGCGGTSRYLVTNMAGPLKQQNRCTYKIQPSNLYVCQLRINITVLMLEDPDVGPRSSCSNDKLIVQGHKFELCGLIADQHFYVPIDGSNLYSQVEFEVQTQNDRSELNQYLPMWQFSIQQLQCPPGMNRKLLNRENANIDKIIDAEQHANSMLRTAFNDAYLLAPRGCFQYYPNPSGIIKSFGERFYLPNMDYAICIGRRNADTKLVLSNVVVTMDGADDDIVNYNDKCLNDYIYIPMGKVTPTLDPAPGDDLVYKLCGHAKSTINRIETQFPGLFTLTFKSNDDLTDILKEEKFRFSYSVS